MKKNNENLMRSNIPDYPVSTSTETDKLIAHIVETTSQVAVSKTDEIAVMQSMLNDKDFEIGIFDRTKGFVGTRSPRATAISIVNDALCAVTGMGQKEAEELTRDYQFSKRDASRQISLAKDFVSTYVQCGRKMVLVSDPRGEASVNLRYIEAHEKTIPDADNPGETKVVQTQSRIKLVTSNKIKK